MDILKELAELRRDSSDQFMLHDLLLPASSDCVFNVMRSPENWAIVNFPTIQRVESELSISDIEKRKYVLHEKLLGKYYASEISLSVYDKKIQYSHVDTVFPLVDKMNSYWYFVDEGENCSHFYIIRQFHVRSALVRLLLFNVIKRIINNHVSHYHKQLIDLFKTITISELIRKTHEK